MTVGTFAVHPLMMRAGADRLQKAHRHGIRIGIDGESVFFAVKHKAFGDREIVDFVVFRDAEECAECRAVIGRADGGGFVIAKARHGHEAPDCRCTPAHEARQRGRAAQKPVIANFFAIVDAPPVFEIGLSGSFERRLGDFAERVDALTGRFAAGEQVFVADGDISGILDDGDCAQTSASAGGKPRLFQNEEQHRAAAEQRGKDGQHSERI
ncbi:MAG: hypothetical protein V8Q79_03460 [Christensenellales bacterium]